MNVKLRDLLWVLFLKTLATLLSRIFTHTECVQQPETHFRGVGGILKTGCEDAAVVVGASRTAAAPMP